jgi:hypothetical protein
MSEKPSLTRSRAVEQVLAQLDGPIEVNELCRQALDIWPSTAKDPLASMRSYVRQDEVGKSLVFVDDKRVLPIRIVMKGVRFRIPLSRQEAKRGMLLVRPAFDYFLRRDVEHESVQLMDAKGQPLPTCLKTIKQQVDSPFGKHTMEYAAFDLGKWFREQGVRRKDCILVTIEDWMEGCFRLEHEPAKRRRAEECKRQDREFADLLFGMLERARREVTYSYVVVPTAYARMSNPRDYPGSHWLEVIGRDPRMRTDGWAIHYSDWRAPLERMLYGDEPVPQVAFSPEQGRRVYSFKTASRRRSGSGRIVEIQGRQTLADLDRILREAFQHDFSDHLGGFWKQSPCPKGHLE